jgi:hypothetical protein
LYFKCWDNINKLWFSAQFSQAISQTIFTPTFDKKQQKLRQNKIA